jgi:hypothetical protein
MPDKQEPAAWHFKCDDYESVTLLKEHADAMAAPYGTKPIPLYYESALTADERAAILASQGFWALEDSPHAATLRNLLERLK